MEPLQSLACLYNIMNPKYVRMRPCPHRYSLAREWRGHSRRFDNTQEDFGSTMAYLSSLAEGFAQSKGKQLLRNDLNCRGALRTQVVRLFHSVYM